MKTYDFKEPNKIHLAGGLVQRNRLLRSLLGWRSVSGLVTSSRRTGLEPAQEGLACRGCGITHSVLLGTPRKVWVQEEPSRMHGPGLPFVPCFAKMVVLSGVSTQVWQRPLQVSPSISM